jgi:hypothetical protein
VNARRSLNGALAGAVAATVWAAQQPLDKRVFRSAYDDVEILGKLVSRGRHWTAVGTLLHIQTGATFGAVYAAARPLLPGPPIAQALAAAMAEHLGLWPLTRLVDSRHPAREEMPRLAGNARAFAQATWRHALFAVVLGELERRLNADEQEPEAPVPASSNGHGRIEMAAAAV